jgi:hypothetical protein
MTELARGRITAGLPSLSPEKRQRIETQKKSRAMDQENLVAAIKRMEATVPDDGGVSTSSVEQWGRPLHCSQVMQVLRRVNPALHFEESSWGIMGIYHLRNVNGEQVKRFICGMERGMMPEFSIRHRITEKVPDPTVPGHWLDVPKFEKETRGWRTVLARLLRVGLISLPAIERAFAPSRGRSSQTWQGAVT